MSDNRLGGLFNRQGTARPAPRPASSAATPAPAAAADGLVKDTTTAAFAADVIRESRNQPVLVDFWAPWCGPCKQLTPILERVVGAAGGRVKLVKMNIDEHPAIAGQLGIQSIPAVFAFVDGKPVDGFMGALPESEVKAFIDRLAGGGPDPLAEALEEAAALLEGDNAADAAQLFAAVLGQDPENAKAAAGLAGCYLAAGDTARAQAVADRMPPAVRDDPAFAAVKARLKLAAEIAQLGDPAALQSQLTKNPDDHGVRFDLALIAQASGDRASAAGHLLEIIRRDRAFGEDGARRKLLEFFDAWGPMDPATKDARRQLSALLFR